MMQISSRPRIRRFSLLAGFALLFLAPLFVFLAYALTLPPPDGAELAARSTLVLDRQGKLLRPFIMADGRWRMPVNLREVDPHYLKLLIAYEDKRFYAHYGVDPLALLRAAGQILVSGRILSGGSTLSMQVARLIEPRESRSLGAKLHQMARAIDLERRYGKQGLLELYLTLAPFGGNLEGVRAATLAYFGKEPARLSTGEAAMLVALPQSPEARRPDRAGTLAAKARAQVITRLASVQAIDAADAARAMGEAIPTQRHSFPMLAAHRAESLAAAAAPNSSRILTTYNRDWQISLEKLAKERAEALGPALSIAILVVDHHSGQVRASVGGADYFASERKGGIDLTRAIRSPGSALKPFIYGLAFDNGIAHPETMLEDRPHRFGLYAPENFDPGFQGMVSARTALQNSLNLPAVDLLNLLGAQTFLTRLRGAGVRIALPKEIEAVGLALALGGLGITLEDLTALYAGLARGGAPLLMQELLPLQEMAKAKDARENRLLTPVAAYYVADILLGAPPPENGAPGRIAYKTGTSFGYRDAFAVGFDKTHTIGVWVGRADNAAVPGLVGRLVAAPILFDAFARIGAQPGIMPAPKEAIIATNSALPPPLRHIRQDIPKTMAAMAEAPLQIAYPPDGAVIDLASSLVDGTPHVAIKLNGGTPPFIPLINGEPSEAASSRRAFGFTPDGAGFAQITVLDAVGRMDKVTIRLQ